MWKITRYPILKTASDLQSILIRIPRPSALEIVLGTHTVAAGLWYVVQWIAMQRTIPLSFPAPEWVQASWGLVLMALGVLTIFLSWRAAPERRHVLLVGTFAWLFIAVQHGIVLNWQSPAMLHWMIFVGAYSWCFLYAVLDKPVAIIDDE